MGDSDHDQELDTEVAGSSQSPPGFERVTGPHPSFDPRNARWNGGPRFPNPGAAQAGVAGRVRASGIPPLSTAFTSSNDMLHWLQRFDAMWGHVGEYDYLTGLFLAERRDSLGRRLATYDLGPAGPLHPMSRYVPYSIRGGRFRTVRARWSALGRRVARPAAVLRGLGDAPCAGAAGARGLANPGPEATYQAYESQMRFIRDMRHRGELRLRSMPGHPGYWGLTGLRDVCGLAPYLVNPGTTRAGTEAAPAPEASATDGQMEVAETSRRVETAEKSSGKSVLCLVW